MPKKTSAAKARHSRLFELMRQSNRVETMVRRQNTHAIRTLDSEVIAQFQSRAVQSLQADPQETAG